MIAVKGRFILTNKSFSQLKQRQKVKINEWLYEAYVDVELGKIKKYEERQGDGSVS